LKVLFFTPTIERRRVDPWFNKVREKQDAVIGVDHRIVDGHTPVLSNAYQAAYEYALANGYQWVLCVEDDEEPQPDIIVRFLEAAELFPTDGVFMGCKRLRGVPVYLPGIWKFAENPPPINAKPTSIEQIRPNSRPPFPITGGTICSPLFYSPAWFKRHTLEFHGHERHGAKDTLNWDSALGEDLFEKRLRFIAVPTIHVNHWDEKTREVLT